MSTQHMYTQCNKYKQTHLLNLHVILNVKLYDFFRLFLLCVIRSVRKRFETIDDDIYDGHAPLSARTLGFNTSRRRCTDTDNARAQRWNNNEEMVGRWQGDVMRCYGHCLATTIHDEKCIYNRLRCITIIRAYFINIGSRRRRVR